MTRLRELWHLAVIVLVSLGCGATARPAEVKAADVVAITVNDLAPLLVDQYRKAGTACVIEAKDRASADVCRSTVDQDWGRVRLAWADMRIAQNEVADKLEQHKPEASADEYVKMLRVAYCQLRADVPALARAKLPDLPLLPCPEAP